MTGTARHGDECPCSSCGERRVRHEEIVARMRERCPACRVGQPFDGHRHSETGDLASAPCEATVERRRIDDGLADGSLLRRHEALCDCPLCAGARGAEPAR